MALTIKKKVCTFTDC